MNEASKQRMEKIAGDRFKKIEKLEAENKRLRETIDFAIGHLSSMENYSIVSGAIHALKESKEALEKLKESKALSSEGEKS